jgi:hypothetical protein
MSYTAGGKKNVTFHSWSGGKRRRSWLRHCDTSRKVAGSIPDGVTGIFQWYNPSGRTRGTGVDAAYNRNEDHVYFLGGKGGRWVGLTTFPPSCADWHEILTASTSWNPQGLSRPVMGLFYLYKVNNTCLRNSVKKWRHKSDFNCEMSRDNQSARTPFYRVQNLVPRRQAAPE